MEKEQQYTDVQAPNKIIPELIDGCGDEFKWNAMVFNLNGLPLSAYTQTVFTTNGLDGISIDGNDTETTIETETVQVK